MPGQRHANPIDDSQKAQPILAVPWGFGALRCGHSKDLASDCHEQGISELSWLELGRHDILGFEVHGELSGALSTYWESGGRHYCFQSLCQHDFAGPSSSGMR